MLNILKLKAKFLLIVNFCARVVNKPLSVRERIFKLLYVFMYERQKKEKTGATGF